MLEVQICTSGLTVMLNCLGRVEKKKLLIEIEKLTDSLSPLIFRLTVCAPGTGISTVSTSVFGLRPVARLHRAVPSAVLDKGF